MADCCLVWSAALERGEGKKGGERRGEGTASEHYCRCLCLHHLRWGGGERKRGEGGKQPSVTFRLFGLEPPRERRKGGGKKGGKKKRKTTEASAARCWRQSLNPFLLNSSFKNPEEGKRERRIGGRERKGKLEREGFVDLAVLPIYILFRSYQSPPERKEKREGGGFLLFWGGGGGVVFLGVGVVLAVNGGGGGPPDSPALVSSVSPSHPLKGKKAGKATAAMARSIQNRANLRRWWI